MVEVGEVVVGKIKQKIDLDLHSAFCFITHQVLFIFFPLSVYLFIF